MTIHEIVKKLIGAINPVGDTGMDNDRLENLKAMTRLINDLLVDIVIVATENKDRQEYSRKKAGEFANKFLDEIRIET